VPSDQGNWRDRSVSCGPPPSFCYWLSDDGTAGIEQIEQDSDSLFSKKNHESTMFLKGIIVRLKCSQKRSEDKSNRNLLNDAAPMKVAPT